MARKKFDFLWQWMVWSHQPGIRPETMKHSQYRWKFVDGFVKRFNDYRSQLFIPSEKICVDKSIHWGPNSTVINVIWYTLK